MFNHLFFDFCLNILSARHESKEEQNHSPGGQTGGLYLWFGVLTDLFLLLLVNLWFTLFVTMIVYRIWHKMLVTKYININEPFIWRVWRLISELKSRCITLALVPFAIDRWILTCSCFPFLSSTSVNGLRVTLDSFDWLCTVMVSSSHRWPVKFWSLSCVHVC